VDWLAKARFSLTNVATCINLMNKCLFNMVICYVEYLSTNELNMIYFSLVYSIYSMPLVLGAQQQKPAYTD